jgi:cytochrome c oxidase subunit 3
MSNIIGEMRIVEEAKRPMAMNPKKFALWLFLVTVTMLFAAWTSAYIVRRAEGNWLYFDLPGLFWGTTGVIALSSVTMIWAYRAAKRGDPQGLKTGLLATLILGVLFLVGQVLGWSALVERSAYLVGNPSGSFVYVLTGVHGGHVLSALIFLAVVSLRALRQSIHKVNLFSLEMCATYWHFLGGLWLYLFIFLLINR